MKTAVAVIVAAFLLAVLWKGAQLALSAWRNRMNIRALVAGLMTAAYAVSPIDLIPDVFFGIGWLDDLVVILVAYLYIRRMLQQDSSPKPVARHPEGPHRSTASQTTIEVVPDSR
ncbi:MAG: DUF1232 domain-containing protein [Bryobacteraceae bacterium]